MSSTFTAPSPLKSARRQGFGPQRELAYQPSGRAWHWLNVAMKHAPVSELQQAPVEGAQVCGVQGTLSPRYTTARRLHSACTTMRHDPVVLSQQAPSPQGFGVQLAFRKNVPVH